MKLFLFLKMTGNAPSLKSAKVCCCWFFPKVVPSVSVYCLSVHVYILFHQLQLPNTGLGFKAC